MTDGQTHTNTHAGMLCFVHFLLLVCLGWGFACCICKVQIKLAMAPVSRSRPVNVILVISLLTLLALSMSAVQEHVVSIIYEHLLAMLVRDDCNFPSNGYLLRNLDSVVRQLDT